VSAAELLEDIGRIRDEILGRVTGLPQRLTVR